jgi:hypothetical protein
MNAGRRFISVAIVVAVFAYMRYRGNQRLQQRQQQVQQIDPKAAEVESLPTGIEVTHTPSSAKASEGVSTKYKYTWVYETEVRSTVGPLRIVEFGSFSSASGKWVVSTFTRKAFTAEDFASWYACPNAELTADTSFSDHHNWTARDSLPGKPTISRWYYIGVDPSGKRFKGEATVEELPEVQTQSH